MQGQDFLVKCLNPDHDDSHPSMRIDKIDGRFHCFSCSYKGNIFTFFGEKPNLKEINRKKLKDKILDKRTEGRGLPQPKDALPFEGVWRNIKNETYRAFGAFTSTELPSGAGRLWFPILSLSQRTAGFIGRSQGAETPKYLIHPRGAKLPLFPTVKPILGSVMLVEGIFDAINLHDKGITNAMCCFGTGNVNEDKLSILSMRGVRNVDVFMDNDDAGVKASDKIKTMCENVGLSTRIIAYGDKDLDPGALSELQVQKLKQQLYG